jgi:hypothetical protein
VNGMPETFVIKFENIDGNIIQVNVTPKWQSELFINDQKVLSLDTEALMKLTSAIQSLK